MARKCKDLFSRPEKEKIPRGVSKINGPQGVYETPLRGTTSHSRRGKPSGMLLPETSAAP